MIQAGDDLVAIILTSLKTANFDLQDNDVMVITSKIISKSEGKRVDLKAVEPTVEAFALADEVNKDPRVVELVLRESAMVSRKAPNVLITQHRLGFVSANSGIDQSNVGEDEHVLLLPDDPDKNAEDIRQQLSERLGIKIGVVISDSHGRPFRMGNVGVAIGVAGLPALLDLRGDADLFGRELRASIQAYADMIASSANLVSGEGSEGRPVTIVRGLQFTHTKGRASDLNRPPEQDLYR